jgi:hypothetical protein
MPKKKLIVYSHNLDEMGRACSTMRRRGMHIGHWWKIQTEIDHWENQDVDGWAILKCILER